ncbi:MAG: class I SAM-dependent methyltransferase [Actinomycetota bacterium]
MIVKDFLRRADRAAFAPRMDIYPRTIATILDDDYQSLLDVGCGARSPLGVACARIPVTMGVDAHEESIRQSRSEGVHDDYVCMDILGIAEHFGPDSFDVVAALDVIEHLEKDEGFRLLRALETVARRLVVVFTPNGFLVQSALEGNPWQIHKSGWLVGDFQARGYEVLGMNGWKPLRGEEWQPRIRPAALGHRLSALTQPLVTNRPRYAFQLLATRTQNTAGERSAGRHHPR